MPVNGLGTTTYDGREGKIYASRVPRGEFGSTESMVDTAVISNKLWDNADLVHFCSTDTIENRDDYTDKFPFYWEDCNYVVDDHGVKQITAIKGEVIDGHVFNTDVSNVGVFGPKFYWNVIDEKYQDGNGSWSCVDSTDPTSGSLYQLWIISDKPYNELSADRQAELEAHGCNELYLWPECLYWDETTNQLEERDYWCHGKYCAYEGGKPVSRPGLVACNNFSFDNAVAAYNTKKTDGTTSSKGGYSAASNAFSMLFDIVKNATKDSQSIHAGLCQENQLRTAPAIETTEPSNYFPVTIAQGKNVYIHSSVQIGTATGGHDRTAASKNIFHGLVIGKEDAVTEDGTQYTKVYVNPIRNFACTKTQANARVGDDENHPIAYYLRIGGVACSGETDFVIGKHDGYIGPSNTNYHPYRVMGCEMGVGAWMAPVDVIYSTVITEDNKTQTIITPRKWTKDGKVEESTVEKEFTVGDYFLKVARPNVHHNTSGTGYSIISSLPNSIFAEKYVIDVKIDPLTGLAYPIYTSSTYSGHCDKVFSSSKQCWWMRPVVRIAVLRVVPPPLSSTPSASPTGATPRVTKCEKIAIYA